jgi:fluoride exporter
MNAIFVALGGALGAVARFWVGLLFARKAGLWWPWGTLFVNVSGCALIGAFLGRSGGPFSQGSLRYFFPIGFVGAYTTFSTFAFETVALWRSGRPLAALAYVVLSNVVGCATVILAVAGVRD